MTTPTNDRYPAPPFVEPLTDHFVYAGWSVDPPVRLPRVGPSERRRETVARCVSVAREALEQADVARVDVFETALMPPLPGLPRWDVLVLGRTTTPEAAAGLAATVRAHEPAHLTTARNVRRVGDVDAPGSGVYLFNHFTAEDPGVALPTWERVAAWYLSEMGNDNALMLRPDGDAPYALVNHAQAPGAAIPFLMRQLARPSFHTHVRRLPRENGMVSLPLLCASRM